MRERERIRTKIKYQNSFYFLLLYGSVLSLGELLDRYVYIFKSCVCARTLYFIFFYFLMEQRESVSDYLSFIFFSLCAKKNIKKIDYVVIIHLKTKTKSYPFSETK